MLNLLPPGVKPDILFNALFLRRLPANLRQVLATQKHETQRDLAKAADHLYDSGAPPAAGVSVVSAGAAACALPTDSASFLSFSFCHAWEELLLPRSLG